MLLDALSAILRALGFVGLFQAAGAALFVAVFRSQLAASAPVIHRLGRIAAVWGLACVVMHFALEAGRMAGGVAGVFDAGLQRRALFSSLGAATAVRCAGLVLVLAGLRGEAAAPRLLSLAGATLAVGSFALVGHAASNPARWALAPSLLIHLSIVSFWFGALLPLRIVSRREERSAAAQVVERFSRLAFRLVPLILAAGILMALVLLPDFGALRDTYGVLLLAKAAGFALLMALAAANKWRLGSAIGRNDAAGVRLFVRVVGIEYALIAGVLAVTAVMTGFFSPD